MIYFARKVIKQNESMMFSSPAQDNTVPIDFFGEQMEIEKVCKIRQLCEDGWETYGIFVEANNGSEAELKLLNELNTKFV